MNIFHTLMASGALLAAAIAAPAQAEPAAAKSIVLVHGAFVDGSGWQGVYEILKRDGYDVTIVQNPTTSLAGDVALTKNAIAAAKSDVILVGHSYGGAVISEAGNDPKVAGLVYVAAFPADKGESVGAMIAQFNPNGKAPIVPQGDLLIVDKAKFPAAFAGDVKPRTAQFMADAQVPWNAGALSETVTKAAWHEKPSWYLLTTEDLMIPAEAQRAMAVRAGAQIIEVKASHAVFLSKPKAVAAAIEAAAKGASANR
jgi:pimeloyl-ACP methyl ester carboxylesterase